jgi:MerR family transcriptional regulator, light-induced transcriptional regulator
MVQYPIRAASQLTGLPVDTLRAWERRYQAVNPSRAGRGRLYSEADIRRLLLLRRAVDGGHAIGQVASLSDDALEQLHLAGTTAQKDRPDAGLGVFQTLEPILRAIQAYDYSATNEELGRLALLLTPSELVHKAVLPLMRLAGENWEKGIFQIAHEHLLSACVRNLLGGLVRRQETRIGHPGILVTTPSGELHEFGILAAAMIAVAHQLQVAYLGPNLPAAEILFAARNLAPRAVVLGIMEMNATPAVRAEVERLGRELPKSVELWVGGSGGRKLAGPPASDKTIVLEDLAGFERHLARLKTSRLKEEAR